MLKGFFGFGRTEFMFEASIFTPLLLSKCLSLYRNSSLSRFELSIKEMFLRSSSFSSSVRINWFAVLAAILKFIFSRCYT